MDVAFQFRVAVGEHEQRSRDRVNARCDCLRCGFDIVDRYGLHRAVDKTQAHITDSGRSALDALAYRYVNTGRFNTDAVDLWGAEAALVFGPFSAQAEYMLSQCNTVLAGDRDFDGYCVQASYFLTGESRAYKKSAGTFSRVKPNNNFGFDEDGGPGAVELALRYSSIDVTDPPIYGGRQDDITAGINWYLNPNMRMMLNYVHAGIDHPLYDDPLNILQTRFQFDF